MASDRSYFPRSLAELVEHQGRSRGERPFITTPEIGTTLSFHRYYRAVADLAAILKEQGIQKADPVAVLLGNGLNAAVAVLAIITAGGVAVPINPRLASEEVDWILKNSRARLVLTDQLQEQTLRPPFESLRSTQVQGPEEGNPYGILTLLENSPIHTAQPEPSPASEDPALLLYTSGTTGHPKGVVLTHGNLLANARHVCNIHRLAENDIALCVLPIFHINGFVFTLISPLLSGGQVIMTRRFHADEFLQLVREHGVTWFSAVPTILSLLLSGPVPPRQDLATLRFARSASASLPIAILNEFERRFGIPVIETYGITEAAGQVTANPLPPDIRKPGSVGRPMGNELALLDEGGNRVPAGTCGEVVLQGSNVFQGYLDNPQADREAFSGPWFRTGDLGYLDEDGYLFLTGRKKEVINRAGEKISPREVEEVIHRLPEVEAVGVVGVPHPLYGQEVVAFVSVRAGKSLSRERIRSFCREHLAGFKTPSDVLFIEEFPNGPSGKIQRRHLAALYEQAASDREKEKHP